MSDPSSAPLVPVDKALVVFAEKLTRFPGQVEEADLAALRAHGLSDRALHDVVQVVSLFNYYNRVADGLGVNLGDD